MPHSVNTPTETSDSVIIGLPQRCNRGCGTMVRVVYLPRRDRYILVEDPEDAHTSRLVRHNCDWETF